MSPLSVYGNNGPQLPAPPHTTAFSRVFCSLLWCQISGNKEFTGHPVPFSRTTQVWSSAKYESAGVTLVKARQKLLQPLVKILLFLSKHIYWKSDKECKNVLTNSRVVPRSEFL